jgi:hypothetical protein
MPVIVEGPDGAQIEFPDGLPPETMRDAMRKHYGFQGAAADPDMQEVQARRASLHVPLAGIDDAMTPEQEAAGRKAERERRAQEAAASAARTPGQRLGDTAAFAASMPIRMATRGEYGIGDLYSGLGERERDFAKNNEAGLDVMAKAGDVMAGIPALGTMGAAPRSMIAAATQAARTPIKSVEDAARVLADLPAAYKAEGKALGGELRAMLADTTGSAGPNVRPPVVPPVATQAPTAPPRPTITDDDAIAAAARLGVDMPRAVGGGAVARSVAGPLAAIPYAGRPIERAYQGGLAGLGGKLDEMVAAKGMPGAALVGGDAKAAATNWIKRVSRDDLHQEYNGLARAIPADARGNLSETARTLNRLMQEGEESTSRTANPAIRLAKDAVTRPGGMTFNGTARLRQDVGAQLDAASLAPQPGTSMPAMKAVYEALTKDLQRMAQAHGAGQAFEDATARARSVATTRKELQRIIGKKGDVGDEGVTAKVAQLMSTKGTANVRRLQMLKDTVPQPVWDNLASEFMSRLGRNPKDGGFSAARFTTDYGKYSDAAKDMMFGPARQALDDMTTVARQYEALESKFNRSNTGSVNALMEYILKPGAIATAVGGAVVAPAATLGAGVTGSAGLMAGRRMAHYLAQPVVAGAATKLFKAQVQMERAIMQRNAGAAATARDAVSAATAEFAQARAAQTGESEAKIKRDVRVATGTGFRNRGPIMPPGKQAPSSLPWPQVK